MLQTNSAAITAATSQGANGVTIGWQFLVPDLQSDRYRQSLVGKIKLLARAGVSLCEWVRSGHQHGECVNLSAVCSMTEAAAKEGKFPQESLFYQLRATKELMTHEYTSSLAAFGTLLYLVQLLCALIPCADEEVRCKHVDQGQQGYWWDCKCHDGDRVTCVLEGCIHKTLNRWWLLHVC